MSVSFSARRKPKRIGSEAREDRPQSQQDDDDNDSGPVVRRAPKQKSKLRNLYDPSASQSTADEQSAGETTPQHVLSKSTRLGASTLSRIADRRPDEEHTRPTYSKSHLDELKGSTPSTPIDLSTYTSPDVNADAEDQAEQDLPLIQTQTQSLDIASKFGPLASAATSSNTLIPSASEIAEKKKERRLRLAREHNANSSQTTTHPNSIKHNDDFISSEAYDSDGEFRPSRLQVSTFLHNDKIANAQEYTRLVPEDEDIAEGFEEFVDADHEQTQKSGRLAMGMKTDSRKERAKMRRMIEGVEQQSPNPEDKDGDGENGNDDDAESDDSDLSQSNAYMQSQTAHGTAFSNLTPEQRRAADRAARRPRRPKHITKLPATVNAALQRLRDLKESAEMNRTRAVQRKGEIERRLGEINGEKGRIQRALEEMGRELEGAEERIRKEREKENGEEGQSRREGGLDDIAVQGQVQHTSQ